MSETFSINGWARSDERPFLRRMLDIIQYVKSNGQWRLTDFLTPREENLLQSLANREGVVIRSYGGFATAERQRTLVMPDDWYPSPEDFQTVVLCAQAASGTALSHGSVLGSLLGTGLERRKIGDISLHNGQAYVVVCKDVESYLLNHWVQSGRESITVHAETGQIELPGPSYDIQVISVASLRVDAVLAHACHWSRTIAQQQITRGHVSLNHVELTKVDEVLAEGDLLSVRGFGRVRVIALEGESKKGRIRVRVGVLSSDRT